MQHQYPSNIWPKCQLQSNTLERKWWTSSREKSVFGHTPSKLSLTLPQQRFHPNLNIRSQWCKQKCPDRPRQPVNSTLFPDSDTAAEEGEMFPYLHERLVDDSRVWPGYRRSTERSKAMQCVAIISFVASLATWVSIMTVASYSNSNFRYWDEQESTISTKSFSLLIFLPLTLNTCRMISRPVKECKLFLGFCGTTALCKTSC